jgi:DNA primase
MRLDNFIDWAHTGLLQSEEAQFYLSKRGVSNDQWLKHKLGFVHDCFEFDTKEDARHNKNCGNREHENLWCDSCRFTRWSSAWKMVDGNRVKVSGLRIVGGVVLPLTTYSGKTIGFQIRSINEKSYDTFVLSKRPEAYFFGLGPNVSNIWASKSVYLVEGPFDQLIVERLVSGNAIAITTNSLNIQQTKFLERFVDNIYFGLDMDKPGRFGVKKFLDSENFEKFRVSNVKLPSGFKDSNELWGSWGDKKFSEYMKRQIQ